MNPPSLAEFAENVYITLVNQLNPQFADPIIYDRRDVIELITQLKFISDSVFLHNVKTPQQIRIDADECAIAIYNKFVESHPPGCE